MKYKFIYEIENKLYYVGEKKSCRQCKFYRSWKSESRNFERCLISWKTTDIIKLPKIFHTKPTSIFCEELMSLVEIEKITAQEILEYKINERYVNLKHIIKQED